MSKNPTTTKKRTGRPEYAPTAAVRRQVAIAAGGGMSHEEIALGLEISRPTLLKHFAAELTYGAYAKRLEVLNAMHKSAKKGNVTAQRAYMQLVPATAAPPVVPAPTVAAPLGKKEQAQADANTASTGTGWDGLLKTPTLPQ